MARYLYHDCKVIICADFGIDYRQTYEHVTLYRLSMPREFFRILCQDSPCDRHIEDRTWDALIRAIPVDLPTHARYRCLQAVAEYGAAAIKPFINLFVKISKEKHRNEIQSALAFFYDPLSGRTCEWMREVAAFDNRLFQQMVYRIISCCVSPRTGAAFKRSLVYAHQITTATTKRVYLDGAGEKCANLLWKLRRAYEHILFGRFNVDDMTSKYAPLQALFDPSKAYSHSSFNYHDYVSSGKGLMVRGCPDLTLLAPPNKSFPYHHYRGALELISSCDDDLGVVYCDSRLGHHLLDPEDYIFDPPNILLGLSTTGTSEFKTTFDTTEHLAMRITDFTSAPKNVYQNNGDIIDDVDNEFCHKAHLLQPSDDSQYESDVLSVTCHVKDFLLWVISENPTLNLTR